MSIFWPVVKIIKSSWTIVLFLRALLAEENGTAQNIRIVFCNKTSLTLKTSVEVKKPRARLTFLLIFHNAHALEIVALSIKVSLKFFIFNEVW